MNDFLGLVEGAGQAPTSFGQAGYLSANVMIAALESIDGEVNRESINEAIRNLTYESELLGGPFTATGFVGGVQPNPFSLMVQVQDGQFVQVNDFQTFPRQG